MWRYDGVRVAILQLEAGEYVETVVSAALPGVTGEALAQFIATSKQLAYTAWLRKVREWARKNLVDKG